MKKLTVKISSKVKSDLEEFCNRTGTEIDIFIRDAIARAFVKKAVCRTLNAIKKYEKDVKDGKTGVNMDMLMFKEYDKHGKNTLTDYEVFAKSIGLRNKKKAKKK